MMAMATPETSYLLMLLDKMALTMVIVVGSSMIVERTGPFIGGIIATLPISAGPAYIFLALDHDSAFIASAALTTLTANAATMIFVTVYARLAQSHGLVRSLSTGWVVWGAIMAAFGFVPWTLPLALIVNSIAFIITFRACKPYMNASKGAVLKRGRWDIPLRALAVVTLIGTVILLGNFAGPKAAGVAAPFPIVLSSLAMMLHPRLGGRVAAATLSNSLYGFAGFALSVVTLHVTAMPLGSAWALTLALMVSLLWNSVLITRNYYKNRKRKSEGGE